LVNCTNLFDASCGFGGYRESGYGREGGREGLLEYLEPSWFKAAPVLGSAERLVTNSDGQQRADFAIDRTVKLYIAASKRDPIPATAWKCAERRVNCWAKLRLGIEKIFETRWKRHARLRVGADYGAQPGTGSLLHGRENLSLRRRKSLLAFQRWLERTRQ